MAPVLMYRDGVAGMDHLAHNTSGSASNLRAGSGPSGPAASVAEVEAIGWT